MTNNDTQPTPSIDHHLDTQGLICPEPVMLLHRTIRKAESGEYIEVLATDPATTRDIPNFCRHLGHTLVSQSEADNPAGDSEIHTDKLYRYVIQKKAS